MSQKTVCRSRGRSLELNRRERARRGFAGLRAASRVALAGAVMLCACSRKPPPELARLELAAPPRDLPIRIGAELGEGVELVGAKVTPMTGLRLNSRVEVSLFWRKLGEVEPGFRIFTHVLDEAGERILNLDGTGALRKTVDDAPLFPPSAWQPGKVYVDEFTFWVPSTLRTDGITLVAGLFRDKQRLPITRGAAPGDRDRVTVVRLPVQRPPVVSTGSVPLLWVPKLAAEQPLRIDGKLDEPAWQRAASTGQFVEVATGEAATGKEVGGEAKLLHDERALYVGFEVFDDDVRGGFDPQRADPHLWLKDTVEIMIDPDGDGDNRDYYEIQVGPQNLVFDSVFDAYNSPHVEPDGPFGHEEWSAKLESAVSVHGTLDDDREDEGYTVELALPWSSLTRAERTPPRKADTWRMNFYAIQNNGGTAWSPILGQGNFHKASRFGRVRFSRVSTAR